MEYYGITFSNGSKIEHKDRARHKYLYKKKVNGKWIYYYDIGKKSQMQNSFTEKHKSEFKDDHVKGYTKFQDIMGYDERDRYERAMYNKGYAFKSYEYGNNYKDSGVNWSKAVRDIQLANYNASSHNALEAYKSYYKTPLGKLELMGDAIKRGKDAITGLLSKIFKR